MKKTILAVLIAGMIATPCFSGEEIRTEGLFTIENTFWSIFPPDGNFLGFADGSSYHCYIVTPVVLNYLGRNYICKEFAYDYVDSYPVSTFSFYDTFHTLFYGDLQPLLGIGILHEIYFNAKGIEEYRESTLLFKVENNWASNTDPIVCGGIAGLQCPRNMSCIDDPRDYCRLAVNPDCSGFCVYDY